MIIMSAPVIRLFFRYKKNPATNKIRPISVCTMTMFESSDVLVQRELPGDCRGDLL